MAEIFIDLALILLTAFVLSYIARLLKQPLILGYILAGIILGPFILGAAGPSIDIIDALSEFGIAFLLFMVGLHLNPKVIKEIGAASLLVGLAQILLTFSLGFLVSSFLGFNVITSSYIGIALSFSSTIIVLKLLSDRKQLDSLFGKVSIGILIIQDLFAAFVLMLISTLDGGMTMKSLVFSGVISGFGIILVLFLAGIFVLPKITKSLAKNSELLFLFSISWAFLIAALFSWRGFSIEIGALLAGVSLSISPYAVEISSRVRPLRDFFLIIFFIILGLAIQISNIGDIIVNALIFSALVLIFKPLILMTFMTFFGYSKRTNFNVGTYLAQISEFSIIVLALGVGLGHIDSSILSTLTLTLIITITFSSYMIIFSNGFYSRVESFLGIFERKRTRKEVNKLNDTYSAILFGYNRIGFNMLRSFKKLKKKYLVVDYNPDTIASLTKARIPCLYGDAYDPELLDELPLEKADLIVSTIPDFESNLLLIETVRLVNPKAIVIVRADSIDNAFSFYDAGATYVLTSHFLGGEYISKMISGLKSDEKKYTTEREKHIKMLKEIKSKDAEHPHLERN